MKKIKSAVAAWLSRHSMRTKLFILFSATIVAILILTMLLLNYFISDRYRERLINSSDQSYEQAYSFLGNYVETMIFVSDLIYYNGDVQRVLSSPDFRPHRNDAEQYREFLVLDQVMSSAEMAQSIYLARIYIPDNIYYSNNFRHFAPKSELEARPDYERFLDQADNQKVFFTPPENIYPPNLTYPVNVVSLFRKISATDGTVGHIGDLQVCVLTSQLQSVLDKADITESGLVYLIDRQGNIISVSENGERLMESIHSTKLLPAFGENVSWSQHMLMGERYLVNQKQLPMADWMLVALVPEKEIAMQERQIGFIIFSLTLVAVAAVFLISYLIAEYYSRRLRLLRNRMLSIRDENLEVARGGMGQDEIGELFDSYADMTHEIKKLMLEQYKSGKEVKSAQFKALQAQINPHFLYNTLDLINWEAMDHNAPEIADIALSLARFYRISLNKGRQVVSIREELTHVKAYVSIENRHFDDAIALDIDVPEDILELGCINIILQPFVENAIVHGIAENPAITSCAIRISGRREGEDVLLEVEDDGIGMSQSQMKRLMEPSPPGEAGGYGIRNVQSRLRLCYGEAYGLTYRSEQGKGTVVTIRIPAWTPAEAEKRIP